MQAQIRTPKTAYTVDYPTAIKAAQQQFSTLWAGEEVGVEKDAPDFRTKLLEPEKQAFLGTLKLFTQYELEIGAEFWGGKFSRMFPRPDIKRAANAFAFAELNSHAPFYDAINKALNVATNEFYLAWKESPVMVERMEFIESYLSEKDPYKVLAAFSFMEGAVLYSSFGFLKSFNTQGYNMMSHVSAGVDASAKEEHFHFKFTAWTFRQLLLEERALNLVDDTTWKDIKATVYEIAKAVYDHENAIIEELYSLEGLRTITKEKLLHFVRNRIDTVLADLHCEPLFGDGEGEVAGWFYEALSSYKHSDFFANTQVQYVRDWNRAALAFQPDAGKTKGIGHLLGAIS